MSLPLEVWILIATIIILLGLLMAIFITKRQNKAYISTLTDVSYENDKTGYGNRGNPHGNPRGPRKSKEVGGTKIRGKRRARWILSQKGNPPGQRPSRDALRAARKLLHKLPWRRNAQQRTKEWLKR